MAKFEVHLVCGEIVEEGAEVDTHEFDTEAERSAFIDGVEAAAGYLQVEWFLDKANAEQNIKERLDD